ncbi:MAG: glycoside hydrolase family 3 N-terminal domain-containing protein [Thermomicrobiales bacterium]
MHERNEDPAFRFSGGAHDGSVDLHASLSRGAASRRALLAAAGAVAASALLPLGAFAQVSSPEIAKLVEKTMARMTLTQKIAQLFVMAADSTSMTPWFAENLRTIQPGGVIFFGKNIGSTDEVDRFVNAIHETVHPLPPVISIDQEGGPVVRVPGDPAPGAVELGQLSNPDVRTMAKERAKFLAQFGFDINFAPVADVAFRPDSAMASRSFGSDPRLVADKVQAVVRGSRSGRVVGAAKHFPGHGRTSVDSHQAIPVVDISRKDWLASDALPFASAIKAGVEMIMMGHLAYTQWDTRMTSLSPVAVKALRKDLGFRGIIVTDDLGMGALAAMDPFQILDQAAAAGIDMFLYASPPAPWADLVAHLQHRVESGHLSEKRIDASVRRIATLKFRHFELAERAKG